MSELVTGYASAPEDSDELRVKKVIGIAMAMIVTPIALIYALLYFYFAEQLAGYAALAGGIFLALGFLTYGVSRKFTVHFYYWVVVATLMVAAVHVTLGGFSLSGVVIVWLLSIPVLVTIVDKPRTGLIAFVAIAIIYLLAGLLQPYYLRESNHIPPEMLVALDVINTIGVLVIMMFMVHYYVWKNEELSLAVSRERKYSDTLLLNILPQEIATILKKEQHLIAEQHDGVSILFADIEGFTPMTAEMTASQLVGMLNEVFSVFDELVEKYDVEKIKTIGDSYMVAAGVPSARADHARVLTRLAIEMRDYVAQHEFGGKSLTLRIGINSGPVVAGVIGRKKFSYDIWGDAVNTASRMESQGKGGKIQITESTYEIVKNDFVCEAGGIVDVKGKGEMKVWFVLEGKR